VLFHSEVEKTNIWK